MADLIGRTVSTNWKSCQASRKTTSVAADWLHNARAVDFTFRSRIVYSAVPRISSRRARYLSCSCSRRLTDNKRRSSWLSITRRSNFEVDVRYSLLLRPRCSGVTLIEMPSREVVIFPACWIIDDTH